MSFMDKVRAQAEQAMVKAQQGATQAQSALNDMQTKRAADGLLRNLGAAYYALQRSGGNSGAVEAAMASLDAHAAANGPIDTAPTAPAAAPQPPPPPAPTTDRPSEP